VHDQHSLDVVAQVFLSIFLDVSSSNRFVVGKERTILNDNEIAQTQQNGFESASGTGRARRGGNTKWTKRSHRRFGSPIVGGTQN
jgi:hypothetical protein